VGAVIVTHAAKDVKRIRKIGANEKRRLVEAARWVLTA
jgi:hypothetical protein